jgi:hypothetical protein
MTQYNLFDKPTPIANIKTTSTKVKQGQWYNIDGYKEPGLVTLIMNKWVELDSNVSPCFYAKIEDLTPKQ